MGWFKSKKEVFSHSGPHDLTNIDWNDLEHRRTIMASLVRGVYILERDRQKDRHKDALAPPWWEHFNFKLDEILKDGSGFFGAIFQFKHSPSPNTSSSSSSSSSLVTPHVSVSGLEKAPQYVVAFRGTMLKKRTIFKDLFLDATILVHCLHYTPCFRTALGAVVNLTERCDSSKIWLAGHSLGSATAMLVAKKMVCDKSSPLETYLFNSPFPSPAIGSIKIGKIPAELAHVADGMLRVAVAALTELLTSQKRPISANDRGMFDKLSQSGWKPYLFVNKSDRICKGFIDYFERRETMKKIGLGSLENLNMRLSLVGLFTKKISGANTVPIHVLPSAVMVVSSFSKAHSLDQWYRRDVECHPPKPYEVHVHGMLDMAG